MQRPIPLFFDQYGRPVSSVRKPHPQTPTVSVESKTPVLEEARAFWKRVKDHPIEKKFRDEAIKNIGYFTGEDQGWDDDNARASLEAEGRPALTLNRTHPIIRLICGARPKAKVTYIPTEQGKEQTAAVLSSCKDHVDDDNQWEFKEDDVLFRALVLKRAIVELRPDYSHDPRGEIGLHLVNSNDVYLDPDSEERDRSDQQRMIVVKNVAKEEALRMFPRHKTDIENFSGYVVSGVQNESRDTNPNDGYADSRADYYDNDTKKISLVYYWYKTYETAVKIVDAATGKVNDSPLKKDEAEAKIAEVGGSDRFRVIEREFTRVNWLVFCHDIEFERGVSPWERQDGQNTKLAENFPFIIEELDRIVFGLKQYLIDFMFMLRDPQKYHNKLASSILHIINTQAKGGYDYEVGALSPENKRKLEESGSKPGVNIEWETGGLEKMKPRQPGVMPQAEMAIAESMSRELLDISGVESLISTKSLGKKASGKALDIKTQQGGNIISWIYRYHAFFMHQLAEYVRDGIQTIYTYQKVIRIRGDKPKYITLNQVKYDQQGGITEILNNVTEGKFGTKITEKEDVPTMKLERFKYFADMVKGGLLQLPGPVMVKVVFELMDDPDLKEIVEQEFADFVAEQQKAQAAAAASGKPQIDENVDWDRMYPLLARSEQIQWLLAHGIRPDMAAEATGLPDANMVLATRDKTAESQAKIAGMVRKAGIDGQIKAGKAKQDMGIKVAKAQMDMMIAAEKAKQSGQVQQATAQGGVS